MPIASFEKINLNLDFIHFCVCFSFPSIYSLTCVAVFHIRHKRYYWCSSRNLLLICQIFLSCVTKSSPKRFTNNTHKDSIISKMKKKELHGETQNYSQTQKKNEERLFEIEENVITTDGILP